jgi:hypothetical protein
VASPESRMTDFSKRLNNHLTGGRLQAHAQCHISGAVVLLVCAMIVVPFVGLLCSEGFINFGQQISFVVLIAWILRWLVRNAESPHMAAALVAARVGTVLVATILIEPYYLSATGLDAELYHSIGMQISQTLRMNGTFPRTDLNWGTNGYAIYTGICYLMFGPSRLAVKLMNTGIAAIGSILFYKAYVSYYGRTSRLLRLLLFFSPTLLYWSSIHGKDPLTFFSLGLGFWGTAKFAKEGSKRGFIACLFGALCLFLIRPHISCVFLGALSVVFIVRSVSAKRTAPMMLASISCLALAVLAGNFFVRDYLQDQESSPSAILERVSTQHYALDTGNAALEIPSLLGWKAALGYLPYGAMTVMFRPFPWESGGLFFKLASMEQLVLTAAEITFIVYVLLGLSKGSLPGRRLEISLASADVLTLFVAAFWTGFVLLFTYISGNLGTLAREKIQLAPFVWCGAFAVVSRYRATRAPASPCLAGDFERHGE